MKTLRFFGMVLVTVLLSVGFAACSSNDENNSSSSDLIGKWICTSSTFTPNENGRDPDNYYEREDGSYKYGYGIAVGEGLDFLSGGKCLELDGSESEMTWTLSSGKLSIIEGDDDRFIGTYTISGDELTFTYKRQDWNGDYHTMTAEFPKTYVSVFKKN